MQRTQPITTLEELQILITDVKSSFGEINISTPKGLEIFNHLLTKYISNPNRIQKEFKDLTDLSQDTYRKLRGYKKGGTVGPDVLLRSAFGLGITYEEAVILFQGFGHTVVTGDDTYSAINKILFELNKLYRKYDSEKRRARLDELIGEYDLKLR